MEFDENSELNPNAERANSSNITLNEIDPETANKLRGDAIGDTMYSEVFVLKTLLQFNDLKWSDTVEEDLCFLWDMTQEKDVCEYLFKASYPSLACAAISKYDENRFVEIVIGILANLMCSDCEKNITEEEINSVLRVLESDDPLILIQVVRFIHALSFVYETLPFITEQVLDKLVVILVNSTHEELLLHALKTLSSITQDMKLSESVVDGELLECSIEAHDVITKTDLDLSVKEQQLATKYLIEVTCNICSYVKNLNHRLVGELSHYTDRFVKVVSKILNFFTLQENLLPISDEFEFYLEALAYIFKTLSLTYDSLIVVALCRILLILIKNDYSDLKISAELFCYLLSRGNLNHVKTDLQQMPLPDVKKVLVKIENSNFNYEFEYSNKIKDILKELC